MKFTKREIVQAEGNSLFLKFKDGESVSGVFRGEIYEYYQKWVNGRSVVSNPLDQEAKLRFRANFVMKEDNRFVAKIWEFGVTVYNQLADINEEYALEETKVKITRRGNDRDTTYAILPLLKETISEKDMKLISGLPLNMLEHKEQAESA